MHPDGRRAGGVVTTRVGTFGDVAAAALAVSALSGVALAVPYEPDDAYASLAALLITNPAGVLFRNLHYWAGQVCLVATVLHAWDHLRARTEDRVKAGVWLRLAITLPFTAFILLSGFLLRGDADAQQALRIVTEATAQVPLAGPMLATLVFGAENRLDVVYVQHVATATIAVWLFVVEHSRRVWPRPGPVLATVTATLALSLVLSPGLHDGLDPVVKGPWYFLGLQEILHWTPWPVVVVAAGAIVVGALFAVRVTGAVTALRLKLGLLACLVVYGGLCVVGGFFRGENWAWETTWPTGAGNLRPGWVFAPTPGAPADLPVPLPAALNRPEGCLVCHTGVTGLGQAHRPDAVGCASCHGGDALTLVKARAHAGMETIPGGLATARLRCGLSACHPTIIPRVERSLMATMAGVIAVNRTVFGEPAPRDGQPPHVAALGQSAADTHLRQLCASCHLGHAKDALGPNGEDTRGGGCNACHLSYSAGARQALQRYETGKAAGNPQPPTQHPAVSLDVGNAQCFGCHSRSGRISTSYEGWHEMHDPPASASDPARPGPSTTRVLADGRVFERVLPDVHQQRGLDCVDCHTAGEVMGDGKVHGRKGDALRVACTDCHARPGSRLATIGLDRLDPESRRILAIRQWPGAPPAAFGVTRTGDALVNVVVDRDGAAALVRKRTGERRPLKPALDVCAGGPGHARLSCGSCHTAWAPRCPTCHTSFDARAEAYDWVADEDVTGGWRERGGPFAAAGPTLGVRTLAGAGGAAGSTIETFIPGMVMTLDRRRDAGAPPDEVFRRLYARIEPHTTRREARSCVSCHADPEALGYGRGVLRFDRAGRVGRWQFVPAEPAAAADGLPADAWVPFLGSRRGVVSTRGDVRPFTVEEQRRVLAVGACLTCHAGDSRVMRESVRDFAAAVARRRPACATAVF